MNRVSKGVIWRVLQQYSSYFIKFVVQIYLARLLMPEDFGLIAEVLVFVNISETIATSGLGTALIQKKNADELDYATVLTGSIVFSIIVYVILFFTAPMISNYYEQESMTKVLRIFGICIFFTTYSSIQNAFISKSYSFNKAFLSNFISVIISGSIAIFLAYKGYGVWSLVVQSIVYSLLSVFILQLIITYKPKIKFSFAKFKSLFSFSWKVLASSILGSLLENIYSLYVGKGYGEEQLGYYNRGNSIPSAIVGQLRIGIAAATFPFFTENQDDDEKLLQSTRTITRLSVLIIFPMALGIIAISEPFVRLFLTEKWLPCLFFLRLECIFYGTLPISASLGNALSAKGRSDISMYCELGKLILTILAIIIVGAKSLYLLCILRTVIAVFTIIIYVIISKRIIGYGFKEVLLDTFGPLVLSLFMMVCCYSITYININTIIVLLMQLFAGVAIYSIGVYIFMKKDILTIKQLFFRKRETQ